MVAVEELHHGRPPGGAGYRCARAARCRLGLCSAAMAKIVPFDVAAVTGCLGAELRGVDLRTMDDATFAAVEQALVEHEVVLVRDMHLTEDEQLALGARCGTLNVFPMAKIAGRHEALPGRVRRHAREPTVADAWHTDVTWIAARPDVAILCLSVAAERGGDTMWSSMTTSIRRVVAENAEPHLWPPRAPRQHLVRPRDAGEDAELDMPGGVPDQLRAAYPPVEHP